MDIQRHAGFVPTNSHPNPVGTAYKFTTDVDALLEPDAILLPLDALDAIDEESFSELQTRTTKAVSILRTRFDAGLDWFQTRVMAVYHSDEQIIILNKPIIKDTKDAIAAAAIHHGRVLIDSHLSIGNNAQHYARQLAREDHKFYIVEKDERVRQLFPNMSMGQFVLCHDVNRANKLRKRRAKRPKAKRILYGSHMIPLAGRIEQYFMAKHGLPIGVRSINRRITVDNITNAVKLMAKLKIKPTLAMLDVQQAYWRNDGKTKSQAFPILVEHVKQAKPKDETDVLFQKVVRKLDRMRKS